MDEMDSETEVFAACPSCGSRNRAVAKFCGQCGTALACPACGAALQAGYRFCGQCGSNMVEAPRTPSIAADYTAIAHTSRDDSRPQFYISMRLRSLPAALSRMLSPADMPLLIAGALLVVAAQAYLTLSFEQGRSAPAIGISAIALGAALFALGTFARSGKYDASDALDSVNIPSPNAVMGRLTPVKVGALLFGVAMMALLLFRLLSGSEAGWDMLPWLLAIGAFTLPFIRRPALPRLSIPRQYYADTCIVLALVGIFTALNAQDLTDWYYSAIGDEYAHYSLAKHLADNGFERPFELAGVYEEINPVFGSIYQASVMRLFGVDNFGWKFSLIISIAIAIPGMYILGYALAGRTAAIVASVILAFSHYIFAFTHTGYPNTDSIPVIVWAIALFVLGSRRGSPVLVYLSGVVAGFGLLFNIVAIAALAITILYALIHPQIRAQIVSLWHWALGVALTALPVIIINGDAISLIALEKIVSPVSQHAWEYDSAFGRMASNAAQNLFAFNYNPQASHFVSGALLDPVSAVLAVLGLGYALGRFTRGSSLLLLITLAVIAAGTALLSPYPYVPITRMTSMVIPLALAAGVGASYLMSGFTFNNEISNNEAGKNGERRTLLGGRIAVATLAVFGIAALALNAWQFWGATPKVHHHTREAVAIGAMRSDACAGAVEDVVIVGRTTIPLLKPALESYHTDERMPHLTDHQEIIVGKRGGAEWTLPISSPRCIVLMNPDEDEIQPFKQDLADKYPQGRFAFFSSPSGLTSVEIFVP